MTVARDDRRGPRARRRSSLPRWGVSGLAYPEATLNQKIDGWCASHVRCFQATRWAPPVFLPPTASTALWLFNMEELVSFVPMVQAALYSAQLGAQVRRVRAALGRLDHRPQQPRERPRKSSTACRPRSPNRFVHPKIRVDAKHWCACGAANGIAPEVLFVIELETGAASPVSSGFEGARLPEPPELGVSQQHRQEPQRGSMPRSSVPCSEAWWPGARGGPVHRIPLERLERDLT